MVVAFGVLDTAAYEGYPSETLNLKSSKVLNALQNNSKAKYAKLKLYDAQLTEKIDGFIRRYNSMEEYDSNMLRALKTEVDDYLYALHQKIRQLNGRPLTEVDKNHYLTIYRLREIDRKIIRELRREGNEFLTYFQSRKDIPDGSGRVVLQILEPESPDLLRYYEMSKSSPLLTGMIEAINAQFLFGEEHIIKFYECKNAVAPVYDRVGKSINICYKEFKLIEKVFYEDFMTEQTLSNHVVNVISMILIREVGRVFIDVLDIDYSGKIENTLDQLAFIIMAEVYSENWEEIQERVVAYAKALYRIQELIESERDQMLVSLMDIEASREELENQRILLLNDTYDNSILLGKQRFYSIITMLVGFKGDIFTHYTTLHTSDEASTNPFPDFNSFAPRIYLRSSNYWYNTMKPYFNYTEN